MLAGETLITIGTPVNMLLDIGLCFGSQTLGHVGRFKMLPIFPIGTDGKKFSSWQIFIAAFSVIAFRAEGEIV